MIHKADMIQIFDKALKLKKQKYQNWPIHLVAQSGFVFRKAGELMFTAQDIKYNKITDKEEQRKLYQQLEELAYENLACTLRFLERLKRPVDNEPLAETTIPPAPDLFEHYRDDPELARLFLNREMFSGSVPVTQSGAITVTNDKVVLQHNPPSGE